jgi:hypothetical protein
MGSKWTAADVPDQSGRVAVITGANTGIGYQAAAVLADRGAHVVLAVRNLDKGNDAKSRITAQSPGADVAVQQLDLTSLDSVRTAAEQLRAAHPLQRQLAPKGTTIALAAHPGGSNTELVRNSPVWIRLPAAALGSLIFQSPAMGALPTLRAATDPAVRGGQYYGPDGLGEQRSHPKLVQSSAQSHDEELQRRLWKVSEELTGVTFPV